MKTSRRLFLSGASALTAAMVAGAASAQDVISDILKASGRGNWDDTFDARASETGKVASNLPIFSPQTVMFTEQAIGLYQNIASQGGWPQLKRVLARIVSPQPPLPLEQWSQRTVAAP